MYRDRNPVRRVVKRLIPNQSQAQDLFSKVISLSEAVIKEVTTPPKPNQPPKRRTSKSKTATSSTKRNESYYRDKLARKLGGKTEVSVPGGGRIDILTRSEIIEVKRIAGWRGAIGQIRTYGHSYPNHRKRLHLFGDKLKADVRQIESTCRREDVWVTWEDDEID